MLRRLTCFAVLLILAGIVPSRAWADEPRADEATSTAKPDPWGGKMHFPVGLTYVSGIYDVDDAFKKDYTSRGYGYDSFVWPVGLSFQPYWEFNNGLGIGASIGPVDVGAVSGSGATEDTFFAIIPIGLDLRYTFFNDTDVAPYVRAGARYPITAGDLVENGQIGLFGAIGVEFFHTRPVGFGIEASYDDSKIDVVDGGFKETIKPYQFMVTLFIVF